MKKAALGEMRERLNRAVSKTVVPQGTGGSNPPLSVLLAKTVIAIWRNYAKVRRKSGDSIVSTKRSFPRGRPRRVICYRGFSILERCPSGRRCTLGRRVCSREYRGFESPSLRTADTNCYNNMAVCALKRVESGDSNRKVESPSLRTYS